MDPALWELLRSELGTDGDPVIEAIIRLSRPDTEIPGVRLVARFGLVSTCRIRARDVIAVRARDDVVSLKAARGVSPGLAPAPAPVLLGGPPGTEARPTDVRRPPGLTLTGKDVVVASVDWGVDLDCAAFRQPADPGSDRQAGGTRFLAFWDQRDLAPGPRPQPYGYGTVHDRANINEALRDPRPYRRLGYHPAIADAAGQGAHGTHVLDIAAGNGQAGGPAGIAPEADLVSVHLADRSTGGLGSFGDSVRLLEAVDFISLTAGPQPCVINISAGRMGGPKDGSTLVERALDELVAATPGRLVVNSAGNYFRSRTHACGNLAPGETRALTFDVDLADITVNELEIWYDGADELTVRVDPPGYTGRPLHLGERADLMVDGRAVGRIYHREHDPNNGDNHIAAYLDPIGCAGRWTVTLEARRVTSGRFHAWIERDDSCRGCQARFTADDSNRATTVGTIATSHLPLIVGAYDGHDPARPAAPFSSAGPTRDSRGEPGLAAPGVDVLAARSAPVGASRNPGLQVRKSGTSMATPYVAGAVALCLQAAGGRLSAGEIRSLVLGSCDPVTAPDPLGQLGHGYLNIPRLIAHVQRALAPPVTSADTKEPTMDTDDTALLAVAPAAVYRECLYRPGGQLARWVGDRFDVVARPGQRIDQPAREGDVFLEVTLGHLSRGRSVTLAAHNLQLVPAPGRLGYGQLLLRPRRHAELTAPLPVEPVGQLAGLDSPGVPVGAPDSLWEYIEATPVPDRDESEVAFLVAAGVLISAAQLGLAVFDTAMKYVFNGSFAVSATPASYIHKPSPVGLTVQTRAFHFSLMAFHPRLWMGSQKFYFKVTLDYDGFNIRSVRVIEDRNSSSTLVQSTFSVDFTPQAFSPENEPVAKIKYLISGRWNPVGTGDESFDGQFLVDAAGNLSDLRVSSPESWLTLGEHSQVGGGPVPVPTKATDATQVHFDAVGSDRLTEANTRHLYSFFQGLTPAVQAEVKAGTLPIQLVGRASTTGTVQFNQQLGRRRANAVAAVFRDLAGSFAQINISVAGELGARTKDAVEDTLERRVDVSITYDVYRTG